MKLKSSDSVPIPLHKHLLCILALFLQTELTGRQRQKLFLPVFSLTRALPVGLHSNLTLSDNSLRILFKIATPVLALAAHIPQLEQYGED